MKLQAITAIVSATALAIGGLILAQPAAAFSQSEFQLPVPCGETWQGMTRWGHAGSSANGERALDLNWGSGAADSGKPVWASAGGTVTKAGGDVYNSVHIDHGGGWSTRYLHMRNLQVSFGQTVPQGYVIGDVSDAGSSGSYHLHYEQRLNNALQHVYLNGSKISYYFSSGGSNGYDYYSHNCPSQAPPTAPYERTYTDIIAPDIDGNGEAEIGLFRHESEDLDGDDEADGDTLVLYPGNSDGTLGSAVSVQGPTDGHTDLVYADLDGDGTDEVGYFHNELGRLHWRKPALASASWGTELSTLTGLGDWDNVLGADLDGDGDDEIGFVSFARGRMAWYEGTATGGLGGSYISAYDISTSWDAVVAGNLHTNTGDELYFARQENGATKTTTYYVRDDGTLSSAIQTGTISAGWMEFEAGQVVPGGLDEMLLYRPTDGMYAQYQMGSNTGQIGARIRDPYVIGR